MKPRVFKDHALHVEMWKWLSEHPDKEKEDWPRWEINGGDVERVDCLCFACETAEHSLHNSCADCPINWGKKIYCACVFCTESAYDNFNKAEIGSPARSKYALEIANLPLAKGWIDSKPKSKLRAYTCWVNGTDWNFTVYALDAHHARLAVVNRLRTHWLKNVDYFSVGARLTKVEKRNFYKKRER